MLIIYRNNGSIQQIVHDPVPPGLVERYREAGMHSMLHHGPVDLRHDHVTSEGLARRPDMPITLQQTPDGMALLNIPAQARLRVFIGSTLLLDEIVNDGDIEIPTGGIAHRVLVERFPYLPFERAI